MLRMAPATFLALSTVALAGCSRPRPPGGDPPPSATGASVEGDGVGSGDCEGLFKPPPGADLLCSQHDMATSAEVHWRSFGSKDARASVDARYKEIARKCGATLVEEPTGLSITRGPMHLSTHDAKPVTFPSCERAPAPGHQAVVLISSMFQR